MPSAYLNGHYLPAAEARVSVLDRGFLFGDGIYEVIPVFGGRLFRLDEHLQRLSRSLAAIHIDDPHSPTQWRDILRQLIDNEPGGELTLYLQVTRGAGSIRDHAIDPAMRPTVFAMASPTPAPDPALRRQGVRCITTEDIRWLRCDIKAITLLPAVLMRQQAVDAGAQEALLLRDGFVNEGSVTSVFAVIDGVLVTPPKSHLLLPGVTRDLVLELALGNAIPVEERAFTLAHLLGADEVWITGSTKEVAAVVAIDGHAVGDGAPGPLHHRMLTLYQDFKQRFRDGL